MEDDVMLGRCAKTVVICTLHLTNGHVVLGSNGCMNPQPVCPRLPGEDYTKCRTICDQPFHAEVSAATKAMARFGMDAVKGARAEISGIGHVCRDCQEKMFALGVDCFSVTG